MTAPSEGLGDVVSVPSVFGEPRTYTAGAAAAAAGVPLHRARRYWRALGYPPVDASAVEFTASDVEMLRLMTGYVDDGALDEPESLRLARMLSQSIAQLARLQVEILADQSARAGRHDDATELARHVPQMQWLLGQIWRRQLDAALPVLEQGADAAPGPASGVGFADIVGFTELSRDRADIELTRIVARFEYRVTEIIAGSSGNVIKLLGDEVLFTADSAAAIADIAGRLLAAFADDPDIPGLRIGLAFGPVVRYLGDVFGTTVNLASRLTALTEPNTILADPALADALAQHPNFQLTTIGTRDIRGIGTMAPALLRRR